MLIKKIVSIFTSLKLTVTLLAFSIVLVFIGLKMVLVNYVHIPTPLSLGVVVLIIAGSILLSVKATRK